MRDWEEEKQDALIREHERTLIMKQEQEYEDQLKFDKSQSFADVRLQKYMITKVTAELEKYSEKLDEIKTKLLQQHNNTQTPSNVVDHKKTLHQDQ